MALNAKAKSFKLTAGAAEFVMPGSDAAEDKKASAKKAPKAGSAPAKAAGGKGGSFFDEPKKVLASAPPPKKSAAGGSIFGEDLGKKGKKLGTAPPPSAQAGVIPQRAASASPPAAAAATAAAAPVSISAAPISLSVKPEAPKAAEPTPAPAASPPAKAAAPASSPVKAAAPAAAASAPAAPGGPPADDEKKTKEQRDKEIIDKELAEELASMGIKPEDIKESDLVDEPEPEPEAEDETEAVVSPAADKKEDGKGEAKLSAKAAAKKKALAEMKAHDEREHLNIVFIGHVDAGKSTISGQLMLLTNQVDDRTMRKYESEAKLQNRESWYIAYIMDTNEEERAKGKTVEVGRAQFTTKNKRYTLLDCPGHKTFVPNMIGGAAQADVGVLVISARKDEFETGFDRGGQTREHAMLAKTLGIRRLIVAVNKMDDPSVNWQKSRFDEIEGKLSPFLKTWGYNLAKEVTYIPISGQKGYNMMEPVPESVCPWWAGKMSFMQLLDSLEPLERDPTAPLRIPVITRYKDMGALYVLGKIESGTLIANTEVLIMPNNKHIQVQSVLVDEVEVALAKPGENVLMKIKGIEEEEVLDGFVISSIDRPVKRSQEFECQLAVLPLLDHKPIITAGYECVLHIHSLVMECKITRLISEHDKKTGKPSTKPPSFVKNGAISIVHLKTDETIAVENFRDFPQLGRFTLRDEGKTIGIGKIMRIKEFTK